MEWKWTKGLPYEKSKRVIKQKQPDPSSDCIEGFVTKDLENAAYSSSLHYDENTWNILNDTVALNGFKMSNKREDLDMKMSDREMIQQIGFNPFLTSTNYADNITISDQFLKPINTTEDRVKNTNKE
jgi:hypothetical protein